jgi:trk system potassium uptake protein TrkA
MYAIVVGGGRVGYYLTKRLLQEGHEVLLMEKDKQRASTCSEMLGDMVMWGDGCEVSLMTEAGFGRADCIIAVTGDDEDNLVICQMAKGQFMVPRTLARVNNPVNEELFLKLGIDTTVSSTSLIYNLIDQQIEPGHVIPLGALKRGNIEVVAISVSERSPILGKTIRELKLPREALVISIVRGEDGMLPSDDIRFAAGDSAVALVSAAVAPAVHAIFDESG